MVKSDLTKLKQANAERMAGAAAQKLAARNGAIPSDQNESLSALKE